MESKVDGFVTAPESRAVRRLLIYPRFQWALIAANAAILVTTLGLIGLPLGQAFRQLEQLGKSAELPAGHDFYRFLNEQSDALFLNLSLAFVAAFTISALLTLMLSHRLAGPIVRLRDYFRQIARSGQINEPLTFRATDYAHDLPEAINQALQPWMNRDQTTPAVHSTNRPVK